MKIVQVLLSPRIGGAESLASSLASEWQKDGHETEIIYLDESFEGSSRWVRYKGLRKRLRASAPDVVLSHSALPNVYTRLAAPRSMPIIPVLHSAAEDFDTPSLHIAEKLLIGRTSHVVAVSDKQAASYTQRFGRKVPVSVIPNGIGALVENSSSTVVPATPGKVLTLSRVADQKNPQLWIETVKRIAQRKPDLEFEWWGPPEPNSAMSKMIAEHNQGSLPGLFAGATAFPEEALAAADFLFHPSDSEAHSISLIEAAANGLPIVCSSDVAETLDECIAAVAFRTGNAEEAAAAISRVLDDWPTYKERALLMAPRVRSKFEMASCAATYLDLFAECLRSRRVALRDS